MSTYTDFKISKMQVVLTEMQDKIDELTKRLELSEKALDEYQVRTDTAAG